MASDDRWKIVPGKGLGELTFGVSRVYVEQHSDAYGALVREASDRIPDSILQDTIAQFGDDLSEEPKQRQRRQSRGTHVMTRIDFPRISRSNIQGFMVMSSTDMFFANRELFGCGYFTVELQAALRRWIAKNEFQIMSFWPERMQERFDDFVHENAALGEPMERFVAWMHQASSPERSKRNALTARESILPRLLDHPHLTPTYSDSATYELCLSTYGKMVNEPHEKIRSFVSGIMKEWDCYPDEGQKEYNIKLKSDWDADIYFNCVLIDEIYVDVALGSTSKLWYLRNFIDFYDATLDPAQKEAFYADTVALSQANDFGPSWGAQFPLEALRA